jgi:hypothetical protein
MYSSIFWDITPCSPKVNRCIGGMSSPSLGLKSEPSKKPASLLFIPEDKNYMFLRNMGWISTDYMVLYPRTQNSP